MNITEQSRHARGEATDAEARRSLLSNDALLARYTLPVYLLVMDDISVRQSIASVTSPARRAAMRLRLLEATLAQRRDVAPKPAKEL